MKKIAIILCDDVYACPYLGKYIDACKEKKIEFDVLHWNRTGEKREYPANYYGFFETSNLYVAKWKKLFAFLRYGKFLKSKIKQEKYDKLIMLTTLPAMLCYSLLMGRYRGKYIFDFRDLSFENNKLFCRCVQKICDNAAFACVSSPGFLEILGQRSLVPVHNFRYEDLERRELVAKPISGKIKLAAVGVTRGDKNNKLVVDAFGNDERFYINLVGRGNDTPAFLEYAKKYSNITVVGAYNNAEKEKYIQEATMLLYYYPCSFNCNRALANKYYDGLIYKKPLLGNIDTYSGKRLMERGLGISLRLEDADAADRVYDYISKLDMHAYNEMAEKELSAVLEEDKRYLQKIDEFLDS